MPVYDYKCPQHGIFNDLATLADSEKPYPCPVCGELSARVILLLPTVLNMPSETKRAHEINERNQHEPTHSTAARRKEDEQHHQGCGCDKPLSGSKLIYTAKGEKMFPSMRPWMISH